MPVRATLLICAIVSLLGDPTPDAFKRKDGSFLMGFSDILSIARYSTPRAQTELA